MVRVESTLGEGSGTPTDPQPTTSISTPSTQLKQGNPKKVYKRKTTKASPLSVSEPVAEKMVYKERDDQLVRANTTASNLEVERDSVNITKTQSKATSKTEVPIGTDVGEGPRCQEAMGVTSDQARLVDVAIHSSDSPKGGNTPRGDEDSHNFLELMALCTKLPKEVKAQEQTIAAQ